MIIDRLYKEVEKKGPICVGLDTDLEYVPDFIRNSAYSIGDMLFEFNKIIIDSTKDLTAVYKLQIAYYEAQGVEGLRAYSKTLKYLKENNILSIGDVKRGDIAATGDMYAKAHFTGDFEADFITVNPYMGFDTIAPYLPYLTDKDKGIFVLLVTSNPGARDIECLESDNKYVYEHIGEYLAELSKGFMGPCDYSSIGFVVGATWQERTDELRAMYPNNFFLIPGYGAQGATAKDIKKFFVEGNGGIVNSSRGIIKAHIGKEYDEKNIGEYFRDAVMKMKEDFRNE